MWKLAFISLFLGASISVAAGIKCYNCNWSSSDTKCLDDVTTAATIDCEGYCLTVRADKDNAFVSLQRSCSLTSINGEIEVEGLITVTQSCQAELCNNGDGSRADDTTTTTAATTTTTAATTTTTAATTTEPSGASSLMLSATIIGVAVALRQVL